MPILEWETISLRLFKVGMVETGNVCGLNTSATLLRIPKTELEKRSEK